MQPASRPGRRTGSNYVSARCWPLLVFLKELFLDQRRRRRVIIARIVIIIILSSLGLHIRCMAARGYHCNLMQRWAANDWRASPLRLRLWAAPLLQWRKLARSPVASLFCHRHNETSVSGDDHRLELTRRLLNRAKVVKLRQDLMWPAPSYIRRRVASHAPMNRDRGRANSRSFSCQQTEKFHC